MCFKIYSFIFQKTYFFKNMFNIPLKVSTNIYYFYHNFVLGFLYLAQILKETITKSNRHIALINNDSRVFAIPIRVSLKLMQQLINSYIILIINCNNQIKNPIRWQRL